jgi:hypothetical protein
MLWGRWGDAIRRDRKRKREGLGREVIKDEGTCKSGNSNRKIR